MTIKRKIRILNMLPVLLASAIMLVLFTSYMTISKIMKQDIIAKAVMKGAFELDVLTTEYMMNPAVRPEKQWFLKYSLINDLLKSKELEEIDDKSLLAKIKNGHADLKDHFQDLTGLNGRIIKQHEKTQLFTGYENKLREHLLIRSHSLASDAAYMSNVNNENLMSHFRQVGLFTVSAVILIMFIMVAVSVVFGRSIIAPVTKLHEATNIIAGGNLDYKIGITSYDEIGLLSNAFDDMTLKLNKSRRTLEKEKDKLQKYLDISAVMVVMINADQEVTLINKKGCKILGYRENEIIGKNWFDHFIPQKSRYDIKKVFDKLMAGYIEPVEYYESRVTTRKGEERLIAWYNTVFRDNNGNIIETLGSGVDITERRQSENEILKEKKRLEEVTGYAKCGLFLLDEEARVTYANNVAQKWFGPLEKIKGEFCSKVFNMNNPKTECSALNVLRTGETSQSETHINIANDGKKFFYEVAAPVRDEKGNISQITAVVIDITERKRMEERIRISLTEKEVLIREVHHRVKNNMAIISSLLKLQANKITDNKYKEMFEDSMGRIKSMAIAHEKLYLSKDLANVDFSAYINDIVTDIFTSYKFALGKVALSINVESVSIELDDAIPLGLIINELVSNSLKLAFPEGREGELEVMLKSNSENEYELTVRDNGIGFPEGLDFRKSESLGLNLVTALTRQIRGRIELNRETGTELRMTFRTNT